MKRLLVTSASLLTLLVKHIANAFVSSSSSLSSRHFKYSPPMDVTKRIIPIDLTNDHYYLAGFSKRSLSIRHASKKEDGEVDLDEGEIFGPLLPLAKGINNGRTIMTFYIFIGCSFFRVYLMHLHSNRWLGSFVC